VIHETFHALADFHHGFGTPSYSEEEAMAWFLQNFLTGKLADELERLCDAVESLDCEGAKREWGVFKNLWNSWMDFAPPKAGMSMRQGNLLSKLAEITGMKFGLDDVRECACKLWDRKANGKPPCRCCIPELETKRKKGK